MPCRPNRALPAHITIPNWSAYQVRIVRDGFEHAKAFAWARHGGQQGALAAAVQWRDERLATLRPSGGPREKPLRHKRSGCPVGITCYYRTDPRKPGRPLYLTFGVHYQNTLGRRATKSFQVGNVADVTRRATGHAARTAEAFRAEYVWCVRHGQRFDPRRYENWRDAVLYPFQAPA